MPKQKLYSVRKGRVPGIYHSWEACSEQVTGFPGAVYKSFESRAEAERFLRGAASARTSEAKPSKPSNAEDARRAGTVAAADSGVGAKIYTDGGCLVNPGPGGYGVVLTTAAERSELSGGFRRTTNNRMELLACIVGLEALSEGSTVAIYTDSKYLANGITKGWAKRWQAMQWERQREPVPNADLWQRLLALCERRAVSFEWLRGHAGQRENERCHVLADEAMRRKGLPADRGYEAAPD